MLSLRTQGSNEGHRYFFLCLKIPYSYVLLKPVVYLWLLWIENTGPGSTPLHIVFHDHLLESFFSSDSLSSFFKMTGSWVWIYFCLVHSILLPVPSSWWFSFKIQSWECHNLIFLPRVALVLCLFLHVIVHVGVGLCMSTVSSAAALGSHSICGQVREELHSAEISSPQTFCLPT